jgi:membrane protein DedA with SNARE-associated domain
MIKKILKSKYKSFIFLLVFVISWSVVLYFINPQKIVDFIGINNGYVVGFLISLLGGVSVASSGVIYTMLATLVAGGLNFVILGIVIGIGASIGDMVMFFVGMKGKTSLEKKFKNFFANYDKWLKKVPKPVIYLFVFIYTAFIPLPNDIILVPLGLAGYSFKKIFMFVFAGNLVFMIVLGYLSLKGSAYLVN